MSNGAPDPGGQYPSPQPSPAGGEGAARTRCYGVPSPLAGEGQDEGYNAAADVQQAVAGWLNYLGAERRYAENTLEAYERDARQFLSFLSANKPTSLARLNALTPGDFRAFLASRRDDGTGSRSLARTLSALRSLFRYLERIGSLQNRSVLAVALPKLPPRLPKPLTETKAKDVVDEAALDGELSDHPWTGSRNQAVLLLLYGSGLRVSEALGLNRKDAPLGPRDVLRIKGKGGRERLAPVLPAAQSAVSTYLGEVPASPRTARPAFRRREGRPAQSAYRAASDRAAPKQSRPSCHCDAARAAALLCDAPFEPWRRPSRDPGTSGPRKPIHHARLHGC